MEQVDYLVVRQVSLVDESGRVRASMRIENDDPWLRLFDRDGTPRLSLAIGDGRPVIAWQDSRGGNRMSLMLDPSEDGSIMWADAAGNLRCNITGDTVHGEHSMLTSVVRDERGGVAGASVLSVAGGTPSVTILGPDGRIIT